MQTVEQALSGEPTGATPAAERVQGALPEISTARRPAPAERSEDVEDGWSAPFAGSIVPVRKPPGKTSIKHLLTRRIDNLPLKAPAVDWAKLVTGEKRMFRTYAHGSDPLGHVIPVNTSCPRPCVLYAQRRLSGERRCEAVVALLKDFWREPLGSIAADDLDAEGFRFLPAFRLYWMRRYPKLGWRPWDTVTVVEVEPLTDRTWAAEWALDQLYSEVVV